METSKIISCYYSCSPSDPLQPEGINGDIMTHLIVGWSAVNAARGFLTVDPDLKEGFRRCVALRKKYHHLKVMLVCGSGSAFSLMANDPVLRKIFVKSAVDFLDEMKFDGLDIDWEFPVWRSKRYDRPNFVLLLRELREAFDVHEPKLILTIAAGAPKLVAVPAYDIPAIAPLVDFVNLMCYDFNLFTYYNIWASHNAPLFSRPEQKGIFSTMNTAWAAEYWLDQGMPREKIVVGIPTYGRLWKLLCPCFHCYNALCVGSGSNGGYVSYPQAMDIGMNGGNRVFDGSACVPYLYKGRQWISFEDEQSITIKAQWIRKGGYGGAMIFSLNQDDFMGIFSSSGKAFPLVDIVYSTVNPRPEQGSKLRVHTEAVHLFVE